MRIEDLQGRRIGRYEVTGLLGRGGMAAVYRALDTALRREIALKILYPQYLGDDDQIERFKREAVVAAGLDHPNIVQIYDVGEDQGMVYIAMQLLPGRALADLLRDRGMLSPHELAPIIDQIASALDYAHARGIIHRDIKPANILIDTDGRAILTDFGIAKLLDTPGLTSTSVMIGTPDYMAPEQIGSRPIDGRADIYALGVMIFRALTGKRPFEGRTDEVLLGHLNGTVPAASSFVSGLPRSLDVLIYTAMARQPKDRFQTAGELAAELRAAVGLPPTMGQRRRPVPTATPAPVPSITPVALATEAPTARGTAYPFTVGTIETPSRQSALYAAEDVRSPSQSMSGYARPARRGLPMWPIVVALLLIIGGGGGYLLARNIDSGGNNTGGAAAPVATATDTPPTPAAETAPPEPTATIQATVEATAPAAVTAEAATAAPTTTPVPPTAQPTKTPAPSATVTPSTTPTPSATVTSTATPTPSATPTLMPTPIVVANGFGEIYKNETIRTNLGAPIEAEQGVVGAEQPFERGGMFWSGEQERTVYVLLNDDENDEDPDQGVWRVFPRDKQTGQDTPLTEVPPPGKYIPIESFGEVWHTHAGLPSQMGYATEAEYNTPFAFQRFERGVMLYSEKGLGEGRSIYVLFENDQKTYQRFDDPNRPT